MTIYLQFGKNSDSYEEETKKLKQVYEQLKRRWYGQVVFNQGETSRSPSIELTWEEDSESYSDIFTWETDVIEIESAILARTELGEKVEQPPLNQNSEPLEPPEPDDEDDLEQTIDDLREKAGIGDKPELEFNEDENGE